MLNSNVLSPRAPINGLMQSMALRIATVIEKLTADGFTVIGFDFNDRGRPTVQIQACARCTQMVERNEAVFYRFEGAGLAHRRTGQFMVGQVRVLWIESEH